MSLGLGQFTQIIHQVTQFQHVRYAYSDWLIEAITLPGHPFGIGVQWHPEWMPEDETQQKLFSAFKQAASTYHDQKGIT